MGERSNELNNAMFIRTASKRGAPTDNSLTLQLSKHQKAESEPKAFSPYYQKLDDSPGNMIYHRGTPEKYTELTPKMENPFDWLPSSVVDRYKSRKITRLYDWQEDLLNKEHVKFRGNFIYSLPTSGGKTLVSEILLLKTVYEHGSRCPIQSPSKSPSTPLRSPSHKKVQYQSGMLILPFVTLVEEKCAAFRSLIQGSTMDNCQEVIVESYFGTQGTSPPPPPPALYICTIEKANGVLNALFQSQRIHELQTVVIDEFHMIGESGGRGITLELLVGKLLSGAKHIQLIGMSATIPNLRELSDWINGVNYVYDFRPIELRTHVVCNERICLAEDFRGEKTSEDGKELNTSSWPLPALSDTEMQAINTPTTRGAKLNIRVDSGFDALFKLVNEVFMLHSTVVFCPTKAGAEATAFALAEKLLALRNSTGDVGSMIDTTITMHARDTDVNFTPSLAKLLAYRVAYHHSGLTSEERSVIEEAFRKKRILLLCCTSTLAAGVNLPVRRVILKSPYVGTGFIKKSQFLQMIGRAGRAGLDDFGEAYLMCHEKDRSKVFELIQSVTESVCSNIHTCLSIHTKTNGAPSALADTSSKIEFVLARYALEIIGCTICSLQCHVLNSFANLFGYGQHADVIESAALSGLQILHQNGFISLQNNLSDDGHIHMPTQATTHNHYALTKLGDSVLRSNLAIADAIMVYAELKATMNAGLIMSSDLHLMYLLTPLRDALEPNWEVYQRIFGNLGASELYIAETLHVSEYVIQQRAAGIRNPLVGADRPGPQRMLFATGRFWSTLILCNLLNEMPMEDLTRKYQISIAGAQSLMRSASYFVHKMVIFCETMEWYALHSIISAFVARIGYGVKPDILPLMFVRGIQSARARVLCQAGISTVKALATATPEDIHRRVECVLKKRAERYKKTFPTFFTLTTAQNLVRNAKLALAEQTKE